jgi:leucyl-tRNA synthetase
MLSIEGKKMSKSKGNFITLKDALNRFGADATRCALLLGGEGMNDPDWRADTVGDIKTKLRGFESLTANILEKANQQTSGHMEDWLISVLQHRIKTVTESMDALKTRTALEHALFEVWNDFRWYLRRKETFDSSVLREALEMWVRLLAPFAPYVCEEIWSKLGKDGFVSVADWPVYDETRVDMKAEETEALVKNVMDDTSNILRATKMVPKEIYYYTAAQWKWKAYLTALKLSDAGTVAISELMKTLMADPELKKVAGKVSKFARGLSDDINRMPDDMKQRQTQVGNLDEKGLLEQAAEFFEREFNVKLHALTEDDENLFDPQRKAQFAKPYRPAIYMQ